MPEVVPPVDTWGLEMTEPIQWLSYELMIRLNPLITPALWRKLHSHDRAMNNNPQNGYDGGTTHRDYINGVDLGVGITNPNYDKMQRGFGGSFFQGVDLGDRIRCDPGVHGIDSRTVTMSNYKEKATEAIEKNWYVCAVSVGADPSVISYFPQGQGGIVVYPFIFNRSIAHWKVYEGVTFIEAWNENYLPDPLKAYLA